MSCGGGLLVSYDLVFGFTFFPPSVWREFAAKPRQAKTSQEKPRGGDWLVPRRASSCPIVPCRALSCPVVPFGAHLWLVVPRCLVVPLGAWCSEGISLANGQSDRVHPA